jgi:hypothetical protein
MKIEKLWLVNYVLKLSQNHLFLFLNGICLSKMQGPMQTQKKRRFNFLFILVRTKQNPYNL